MLRLTAAVSLALLSACGPGGGRVLPGVPVTASATRAEASATGVHAGSATDVHAGSATGVHAGSARPCVTPAAGAVGCQARLNANVAPVANAALAASAVPGYHPADLAAAYGFTGVSGSGTVALIEAYDDPKLEADLGVYRATFGLPPCTSRSGCFSVVRTRAHVPPADAGWTVEHALDAEMVSALCPGCKILVVETATTDMSAMIDAQLVALGKGATAISDSFYASEAAAYTAYEPLLAFVSLGAPIVVSAGDKGAGATYPASSEFVVAVGATTLQRDGSARGWSESAWSDTSSGCSAYVGKPRWQHDAGCARRTVADLAVVGDPATGVAVYSSHAAPNAPIGWSVAGGTSAGAPMVAAMYAATGARAPGGAGRLYADASAFNPILSGTTAGCDPVTYLCSAMPGYNGPGGLGSPVGPATFRSASI